MKPFPEIPDHIQKELLRFNYTEVEAKCPQKIPIMSLIFEAEEKLV